MRAHAGSRGPLVLRRAQHRLRLAARYYLKDGWPEQVLFVLATARTGSNLLMSYLNSLPDVSVGREILNPDLRIGLRQSFISRRAVLRHIRHCVSARKGRIRGVKFLIHQLYEHGISLQDLRHSFPHAKYLIVYRRSLAHQFVSMEIARSSDRWVGRADVARFDGSIVVDRRRLLHFYRNVRRYYARALAEPGVLDGALAVSYEELARDPQGVFETLICPFLGVPATEVRTKMRKQNQRSLEDVVANYDEVADVLTGDEATFDLEALIGATRPE